ncbi:hypothetical protein EG68_11797 [Paragonimus skrjabini miyazakii]|uniref:Uncharacterized protein n=1 Tax=Paragonimus skrjabini miyazakii TaxID=59628 RepID=A0A8S9YL32_9TREM|nr:hypothetical protein EG68_11797 [Paragonimus skrjabini miyazakii]
MLSSNLLVIHCNRKLFIITVTDVSDPGVSAVIPSIFLDGPLMAIINACRTPTATEWNKSQSDKEAFALMVTVRPFHKLIHGLPSTSHAVGTFPIIGAGISQATRKESTLGWSVQYVQDRFPAPNPTEDPLVFADHVVVLLSLRLSVLCQLHLGRPGTGQMEATGSSAA